MPLRIATTVLFVVCLIASEVHAQKGEFGTAVRGKGHA